MYRQGISIRALLAPSSIHTPRAARRRLPRGDIGHMVPCARCHPAALSDDCIWRRAQGELKNTRNHFTFNSWLLARSSPSSAASPTIAIASSFTLVTSSVTLLPPPPALNRRPAPLAWLKVCTPSPRRPQRLTAGRGWGESKGPLTLP
jgi:hypothetical protein